MAQLGSGGGGRGHTILSQFIMKHLKMNFGINDSQCTVELHALIKVLLNLFTNSLVIC